MTEPPLPFAGRSPTPWVVVGLIVALPSPPRAMLVVEAYGRRQLAKHAE
jgi:hypothetical protein